LSSRITDLHFEGALEKLEGIDRLEADLKFEVRETEQEMNSEMINCACDNTRVL
jgi:hypothetical protein